MTETLTPKPTPCFAVNTKGFAQNATSTISNAKGEELQNTVSKEAWDEWLSIKPC